MNARRIRICEKKNKAKLTALLKPRYLYLSLFCVFCWLRVQGNAAPPVDMGMQICSAEDWVKLNSKELSLSEHALVSSEALYACVGSHVLIRLLLWVILRLRHDNSRPTQHFEFRDTNTRILSFFVSMSEESVRKNITFTFVCFGVLNVCPTHSPLVT